MTLRVVTRSSHGNPLYYGLSMFAEFEKFLSFSNLNFSQISQAFPFSSLKFSKYVRDHLHILLLVCANLSKLISTLSITTGFL